MIDRSTRWHLQRAIWALTPPILLAVFKRLAGALARRRSDAPPAVTPDAEPPPAPAPPEWEFVPEGWARRRNDPDITDWNVQAISSAYREKWPSYLEALRGSSPLGVYHETASGVAVSGLDHSAHNMLMSYAYVLALAARRRERISILDWGGGIGHYYALSRVLVPDLQIEYHCKDTPVLCAHGRELFDEAHFHEDESCLRRRYDLVLASSSIQYAEDWQHTVAGLAEATGGMLYLTRVPVALAAPSFVVMQRARAYGYDAAYLGWVLNRDELLATTRTAGVDLVREFLLSSWFSAAGAPEDPVEHRGFLLAPADTRSRDAGASGLA